MGLYRFQEQYVGVPPKNVIGSCCHKDALVTTTRRPNECLIAVTSHTWQADDTTDAKHDGGYAPLDFFCGADLELVPYTSPKKLIRRTPKSQPDEHTPTTLVDTSKYNKSEIPAI